MVNPTSKRDAILLLIELVLFGFALFMTIPQVPSNERQIFGFAPVLLFGGSAFIASLALGRRRGAENWLTISFKLVCYLLFAWVIRERVGIR
jgi:uncharacterized membrane protein